MSLENLLGALVNLNQATDEAWYRQVQQRLPRHKEAKAHKRVVFHQCSCCGETNADKLKFCVRCRAVRYCSKECQQKDWKDHHRNECTQFVHPPYTSAFLTVPTGPDKQYPPHPIFASGYDAEDGVGCWVSIPDEVETRLQTLISPLYTEDAARDGGSDRYARATQDAEIAGRHHAFTHNLLTLEVLVQNRRKDGKGVLIFGAQSHVVSFITTARLVMQGKAEVDNLFTFIEPVGACVGVRVANDIWDNIPRLRITHFNGKEISTSSSLPEAIKSAERGIVELKPSEYVIMRMQFRVGDGRAICKYWQAMCILDSLVIPCFVPGTGYDYIKLDDQYTAHFTGSNPFPVGLPAKFDMDAIGEYYREVVEKGELEFVRSRYGQERTDEWYRSQVKIGEKEKDLIKAFYEKAGREGLEALIEHCRKAGIDQVLKLIEDMRLHGGT